MSQRREIISGFERDLKVTSNIPRKSMIFCMSLSIVCQVPARKRRRRRLSEIVGTCLKRGRPSHHPPDSSTMTTTIAFRSNLSLFHYGQVALRDPELLADGNEATPLTRDDVLVAILRPQFGLQSETSISHQALAVLLRMRIRSQSAEYHTSYLIELIPEFSVKSLDLNCSLNSQLISFRWYSRRTCFRSFLKGHTTKLDLKIAPCTGRREKFHRPRK